MIMIIGSRGRLGHAIARNLGQNGATTPGRSIYGEWARLGAADAISRYLEHSPPTSIIVASGLLDPSATKDELTAVNFLLPKNIIEGAEKLAIPVITIGTVMENLIKKANPYVQSKQTLAEYVLNKPSSAVMHLRVHTLYGGAEPATFMFLGQMLAALRADQPFAMTQGYQLREYHHVDDDAAAISALIGANVRGTVDLSHGQPVRLRDIAQHVFLHLGRSERLQIGALEEPAEENYANLFARSEATANIHFRDTLPAVADYISHYLAEAPILIKRLS
jgi:nucleoside-diphosphate-sugar epimerase